MTMVMLEYYSNLCLVIYIYIFIDREMFEFC